MSVYKSILKCEGHHSWTNQIQQYAKKIFSNYKKYNQLAPMLFCICHILYPEYIQLIFLFRFPHS